MAIDQPLSQEILTWRERNKTFLFIFEKKTPIFFPFKNFIFHQHLSQQQQRRWNDMTAIFAFFTVNTKSIFAWKT